MEVVHRHWLMFVYSHFKSCDQSFAKTSVDFFNIFHVIQSCVMSAKSNIILKFISQEYGHIS